MGVASSTRADSLPIPPVPKAGWTAARFSESAWTLQTWGMGPPGEAAQHRKALVSSMTLVRCAGVPGTPGGAAGVAR